MVVEPGIPRDQWSRIPRHVIEGSLWMRLGFIGLSIAAVAIAVLIGGGSARLSALAWALVGGAVGVFAFRRSWILFNRAEAVSGANDIARPATMARATSN